MLQILARLQHWTWIGPAGFMWGTAPTFFIVWGGWRLLTGVLPSKIYEKGDEFLYSLYQKMVLFFFENCSGIEISISGDIEQIAKRKENVVYLCNHQCTMDWMVADMLADRQGSIGNIRYILKDSLRWAPLYGYYFRQHSCIYVKRSGNFEQDKAKKHLEILLKNETPYWMVVFPEGTRFNPNSASLLAKSQQFARDQGVTPLNHVLMPRYKAVKLTLDALRPRTDAVYDVTVAYDNTFDFITNKRLPAPGLAAFIAGFSPKLHIHIKRIAINDVPSEEEKLKQWLFERFQEKDRLLSHFYNSKENNARSFGENAKVDALPLRNTLPAFLFWTVINSLLISTSLGRQIYIFSALLGTFIGWGWMAISY